MKSLIIFLIIGVFFSPLCLSAKPNTHPTDRQLKVMMRMIGHQILLCSGDSTSRIMSIKKNGDRYHIPFELDFAFNPEELVSTVKSVLDKSKATYHYLVEVETCESSDVVYSFEVGKESIKDMVPCKGRLQPKGCYGIFVTLYDDRSTPELLVSNSSNNKNINFSSLYLWIVPVCIVLIIALWMRKRKMKNNNDPNIIYLGNFLFNPNNMTLQFEDETIQMTAKESELLFILYSSKGITLEREMILKKVWGDNGDYDGRTLDVFISKLRKKLDADGQVKILNIRGVGYKLVYS